MQLLACAAKSAIIRASNIRATKKTCCAGYACTTGAPKRKNGKPLTTQKCKAAQEQQYSLDDSQGQASASLIDSSLKRGDAIHHEISATT
jgi:hypothetical protein